MLRRRGKRYRAWQKLLDGFSQRLTGPFENGYRTTSEHRQNSITFRFHQIGQPSDRSASRIAPAAT
jgi:hypothetical protein